MKKWNCISVVLAVAVCISGSACAQTPASGKAVELFQKGMTMIKEGKLNEGLELLKQTTVLEPEKPDWHMDYGSILFNIGAQLFQKGNTETAKPILQESERQLLLATDLFVKSTDSAMKAQCFYLLGEIYRHVINDKEKAKSFYQQSLALYPQHAGALEALKGFGK
ncbi:MAG TPA: tetratricopeptide repeat protein [Patescibacteria group bacterium]|nr:tetratricopeptide repeat protein [Patescibacteria group bacterium]